MKGFVKWLISRTIGSNHVLSMSTYISTKSMRTRTAPYLDIHDSVFYFVTLELGKHVFSSSPEFVPLPLWFDRTEDTIESCSM